MSKDLLTLSNDSSGEMWYFIAPKPSDHIRVNRGLFYHHGIYIAESEVIHFSSEDDDDILGTSNFVIKTTLDDFLRDGEVEVKVYTQRELPDLFPVKEIMNYARASLGVSGYNLVFNNCEHFANTCTLGVHHSQQVDNIIGDSKNMSLFSKVSGAVKGFLSGGSSNGGGNRSSSSTVYEPDKVIVARLQKEKELELMELNALIQKAMLEAKTKGLLLYNESLLNLLKELNTVAEQQFKIIESSTLESVQKIESYYLDLGHTVLNDRNDFDDKFTKMLEKIDLFPTDSPQYQIYLKRVDAYSQSEVEFFNNSLNQIAVKQQKLIDSTLENKKLINASISEVVAKKVEHASLTLTNDPVLLENTQSQNSKLLTANDGVD